MKENGKKREWVKTAAIIFLSIMLVLTFFSNTFMNYSLPEVATQYVMNGTITAKIRGTGVIESGDPYNVEVKDSRKVASVAVREGDVVAKGDVLIYLEDEDSDELKDALTALETAKKAYDKALLNSQLTASDIKDASDGVTAEDFRKQITNYQNAITAQKNAIKPLEDKVAEIKQQISNIDAQLALESSYDAAAPGRVTATTNALEQAKQRKTQAESDVTNKYNAMVAVQTERDNIVNGNAVQLYNQQVIADTYPGTEAGDAAALIVQTLLDQNAAAEEKLSTAQVEYNGAVNALTDAENALKDANDAYNDAVTNQNNRNSSSVKENLTEMKAGFEMDLYHAENDLQTAKDALTLKEEQLTELVTKMSNVTGLEEYIAAVDKAQEEVDKLTAESTDATIVAPIAGTVSAINVTAGESTTAAVPVVVMQPEGKGYTLSFTVTNEQAKKLSVGDKADLVNAWRYDDVVATLASIKVDKNNPSQQKILTFDVTGSVVAGQSLTLSVGQKSATYDYIVPNSAIREDNNGQFILIVESKSSPLGTRYTATRVDVQVIASDDTQSAITGGVYGYEFVITTSTKPVQAGELVRLAD